MFRDVVYSWLEDKKLTSALAWKVAKRLGFPKNTAEMMTEAVGPEEAQKMVKMAVAWRTGQIPDTSPQVVQEIYDGQRKVAEKLGMTGWKFDEVFVRIYGKRLKNPANAYHMMQTMAYASPTYGPFLEAIPRAQCMLFTRGIARRLDGRFGQFGVNRFGGNVGLDDPCIVWCERDIGCRFDRDRGKLLLDGILEEKLKKRQEPIVIFVYGAGYLTEMFCSETYNTSWLDRLIQSKAQARIYACDVDPEIDLRRMCRWYSLDFSHEKMPGGSEKFTLGEGRIELEWLRCDMMAMFNTLEKVGVKPDYVIAKGVMPYNLIPMDDRLSADEVIAKTYSGLKPGGSVRFDFQLKHAVNLRNGLTFGWGFPIERSMEPMPGGIYLLTVDEFEEWLEELKTALLEKYKIELDDTQIQLAFIRDDLGPMTVAVKITKEL